MRVAFTDQRLYERLPPAPSVEQLSILLQAFRKEAGLTQSEVALRLGVTQQTYSTLERNAETVGVEGC